MASDLITYLVDEKVAEVERRFSVEMQRAVEDTVALRFPNTPTGLVRNVQFLNDLDQLAALRRVILQAPDQAAAEALLAAIPPAV